MVVSSWHWGTVLRNLVWRLLVTLAQVRFLQVSPQGTLVFLASTCVPQEKFHVSKSPGRWWACKQCQSKCRPSYRVRLQKEELTVSHCGRSFLLNLSLGSMRKSILERNLLCVTVNSSFKVQNLVSEDSHWREMLQVYQMLKKLQSEFESSVLEISYWRGTLWMQQM